MSCACPYSASLTSRSASDQRLTGGSSALCDMLGLREVDGPFPGPAYALTERRRRSPAELALREACVEHVVLNLPGSRRGELRPRVDTGRGAAPFVEGDDRRRAAGADVVDAGASIGTEQSCRD